MGSCGDVVFETERLAVRYPKVNLEDARHVKSLWEDPQVMAYVGFPTGLPTPQDKVLDQFRAEKGRIFDAILMVEEKGTARVVGHCNMHTPNESRVSTVDIKLFPDFWGKGLGSELLQGMIAQIFGGLDSLQVEGTPNKNNLGSIRMQVKAGMRKTGEGLYTFPDSMKSYTSPVPYYLYRISRDEWNLRQDVLR